MMVPLPVAADIGYDSAMISEYQRSEQAVASGSGGEVLTLGDLGFAPLASLLGRYGLDVVEVAVGEEIPGSYWGDSEAGLIGDRLYVRPDTPVHSSLHEACHWICMSRERRAVLDTDAGGDDAEEEGVCYLQLTLADEIEDVGRECLAADMEAWGYSWRLGSTRTWLAEEAAEARAWLASHGLVTGDGRPTFRVRGG